MNVGRKGVPVYGSICPAPPPFLYGHPIYTCQCLKPLRPPRHKYLVCWVHLWTESISQRKGDLC